MPRILGFDVGRTHCRVMIVDGSSLVSTTTGTPVTSPIDLPLDEDAAAEVTAQALLAATSEVDTAGIDTVVAGLPGLLGAPHRAGQLATALAGRFPDTDVVATSDLVLAHASLLHGDPGVVVAAGTGAAALALTADGTLGVASGLGPVLGDPGGGHSLGRAGLVAALEDPAAEATPLLSKAVERFGPAAQIPQRLAGADKPVPVVASFAPDVLACAENGDPVAARLCAAAAEALTRMLTRVARDADADASVPSGSSLRYCLAGGLLRSSAYLHQLVVERVTSRHPGWQLAPGEPDPAAGVAVLASDGGPFAHVLSRA